MDLYGSLVANEGSGGGGGTADVPIKSISVNGSGVAPVNKNVDIKVPTKTSELNNDSNFASKDDIPTKTSQLTNDSNFASTTDIPTKVSELDNDSKFVTDVELTAKGYASTSDIPTKTSQLTNDSSFVTASDLTAKDYADKTYVGEQIAQSEHLKREIVTVLPEPSVADEHTIYMLKDESVKGSDKYKEYMLIEGVVQCVGDTSVDLTDYAKTTDIPTTVSELTDSADYAKKTDLHSHDNKSVLDGITSDKVTAWDNKSEFSGSYNDLNDKPTIDAELSNTSENAIQNKVVTKEINKLYSDISFNDNDTATDGISFTDAEDGNMIVTDWTRNLFNPTLETATLNGVTCTNNGDGTYTLNGTSTKDRWISFGYITLNPGKYKFIATYNNVKVNNLSVSLNGYAIAMAGEIFTIKSKSVCDIGLSTFSKTFNNVLIKPMLTTDLSATYDDFVQYGGYKIKSCGKNLLNPNDCIDGRNIKNDFDTLYAVNTNTDNRIWSYEKSNYYFKAKTKNMTLIIDVVEPFNVGGFGVFSEDGKTVYDKFSGGFSNTGIQKFVLNVEPEKMYGIMLKLYSGKVKISLYNSDETEYEPYTGETIKVTNDTESPAFGLKSHKGITNIISQGNVKCVYPTNESGKGVLDSLYNKDKMLTKQKNDLGGLTLSASGTTLSITDGTHTWTLESNN